MTKTRWLRLSKLNSSNRNADPSQLIFHFICIRAFTLALAKIFIQDPLDSFLLFLFTGHLGYRQNSQRVRHGFRIYTYRADTRSFGAYWISFR